MRHAFYSASLRTPEHLQAFFATVILGFLQKSVLFLHYIKSCLSLIIYITVPSSAGRKEQEENGWCEL